MGIMDIQRRRDFFGKFALFGALTTFLSSGCKSAPTTNSKRYLKNEVAQSRSYSQAVITQGGTIIWLAGQTGALDESGKALDFDSQVRQIFSRFSQTLKDAGGQLSDIVTITSFITDHSKSEHYNRIRGEILGDNFPASAKIYVSELANPETLIEVQGVAVIG